MKKSSGTFNQLTKFADCTKIGMIFGSFLGFAEGLGLAINIVKDNGKSFLSVVGAFKFLNISIIMYFLFFVFINLIIYIFITIFLHYISPKFRFLQKKQFYIWLNIIIIGCIPAGIWWNVNYKGPYWEKQALIGDFVILLLVLLLSLAIMWALKKYRPQEIILRWLNRKEIKIFLLLWIIIFIASLIIPFPSTKSERKDSDINVLMIIIDALRADHLGCYGYSRNTSPTIDRLGSEGAIFLNAIAQWPSSSPSHASIFTSTYPHTHQCFPNGAKLDTNLVTIAELLENYGYSTAAFIANPLISKEANFNQGFNSFYSQNSFDFKNMSPKFIFHSIGVVRIFDKLLKRNEITMSCLDWLERNHKEKFFLVLQYLEPHRPYVLHPGFSFQEGEDAKIYNDAKQGDKEIENKEVRRKISLYDGEIAYTDYQIKKIMDKLEQLEILDNTLIVITADHGENLYDHQPYFHHSDLYESSIKVPLIFYCKRRIKPIKITGVVESIDVVPTIMELLNSPAIKQFGGKSLYHYLSGSGSNGTLVGFSEEISRTSRKIGIRTEEWKLIINFDKNRDQEKLYNIKKDPQERKIIRDNEEILINLRAKLFQWIELSDKAEEYFLQFRPLPKKKFSKETLKKLKALGYIR
jgi:arylsulfatase A-like enzyme